MFVIQKSQLCSQDECPERTVMQVLPIQGTFIVVCYLIILIFIKVLFTRDRNWLEAFRSDNVPRRIYY